MLIAFFSTGATAATTHAALLAAHAMATIRTPVTFVRVRTAGEPRLEIRLPRHVRLVEAEPVPAVMAGLIDRELECQGQARASLILDVPIGLFREEARLDRLDACVVTVGASPLDEMLAASMLARPELQADRPAPDARRLWLLGCDRPDHASAALQFQRAMREAVPGRRDGCPGVRFLPANLPTPSPAQAASLLAGTPGEAAVRRGLGLLAALMPDAGILPEIAGPDATAAERLAPTDRPGGSGRLSDIAEALDAMASGRAPSAEAMADATLLEDWSIEPNAVPSLTGYVTGRGRWPVTVDVYATDGMSWARTYSRYFRLGRPAGTDATTSVQ